MIIPLNRHGIKKQNAGCKFKISGYEFQINYNESKGPSSRSDRYQFTVVMPDLNYDVPQSVPQDVSQSVPQVSLGRFLYFME